MIKKVHILKEKVPNEYTGLGIITSETELQITMLINSSYNFNLSVADPIKKTINEDIIQFPLCSFNKNDELICHLIKNKYKGFTLFKGYPKIDFFLLFQGDHAMELVNKISSSIKTNINISLVIPIDQKKMKGIVQLLQS